MKIETLNDIKKLGFIIEEVVNNVTEYSSVDLKEETRLQDFLHNEYTTSNTESKHDGVFTRYYIIKNKTVITELLDRGEVVNFFDRGEYKNYLSDNVAGEMELTKDEMILIDKYRNPEKYVEKEKDYLTSDETTLLEDFINMKKKHK